MGADLDELTEGRLCESTESPLRVISGSLLGGRKSDGGPLGFLGRYDLQVSVLPEVGERELFGWITPGFKKFSIKSVVASKLLPKRLFNFNTAQHGGQRAIVPIGAYERVMPLDILPTFLLKALSICDLDNAEALGALELAEEDLSLLTFVCPGKTDYGPMLRNVLDQLHAEMNDLG